MHSMCRDHVSQLVLFFLLDILLRRWLSSAQCHPYACYIHCRAGPPTSGQKLHRTSMYMHLSQPRPDICSRILLELGALH
ncbi:hypothetical protein B0H13DRAFT_1979179 [Mycena leptocephala]|nr:hypothetical protein B0H13DRAFT_1979179 [Mycena leptocephala]